MQCQAKLKPLTQEAFSEIGVKLTSDNPHAPQIDTAFVDHAVWNDNLGPTSTVRPSAAAPLADFAN
jgi:hypothetical protein